MHEHHEHHEDQQTQLTDMSSVLGTEPTVVAGRYLLQRVIGVGGVAVVHEAADTRLDRQVAVKLLRDSAGDDTDRARFVSEARLLARLDHPRLVRVLDAGIDGHRPFLVLELVRGQTLSDALADLPEARVAEIGAQVAEALAHVHAAGIVHRDVKPGNVLIAQDGSARLTDFGIARLVDDTQHHTRTGMLVGTVAYLAPEQVAGETATTAVDIYAWGLVLLEALTGRRAYAGTSVESALARLHHRPDVPATLPRPWRTLLLAMTATDAAARPTADEVAARLRALRDAEPTSVAGPSTMHPRMVLAGLGAAFALLLGVAAAPALSGFGGSAGAASAHRSEAPADVEALAPAAQAAPPAPPAPTAAAVAAAPTAQKSRNHAGQRADTKRDQGRTSRHERGHQGTQKPKHHKPKHHKPKRPKPAKGKKPGHGKDHGRGH